MCYDWSISLFSLDFPWTRTKSPRPREEVFALTRKWPSSFLLSAPQAGELDAIENDKIDSRTLGRQRRHAMLAQVVRKLTAIRAIDRCQQRQVKMAWVSLPAGARTRSPPGRYNCTSEQCRKGVFHPRTSRRCCVLMSEIFMSD